MFWRRRVSIALVVNGQEDAAVLQRLLVALETTACRILATGRFAIFVRKGTPYAGEIDWTVFAY